MLTVTIRQPYLALIMEGIKTLEVRSRPTKHRGPLALHAAATPALPFRADRANPGQTLPYEDDEWECGPLPLGAVVCVVDLVDCRPMEEGDREAACVAEEFHVPPSWANPLWVWEFANVRLVKPLPRRGNCAFWHVADEEVEYL